MSEKKKARPGRRQAVGFEREKKMLDSASEERSRKGWRMAMLLLLIALIVAWCWWDAR